MFLIKTIKGFFKKQKDYSKILYIMEDKENMQEDTNIKSEKKTMPELFKNISETCKDISTALNAKNKKLSEKFVILQKAENQKVFDEIVNEFYSKYDSLKKEIDEFSVLWADAFREITALKISSKTMLEKKKHLFNSVPVQLGIVNDVSANTPIDDPGYFAEIQRRKSINENSWKILNTTLLQDGSIETLLFKDGKTVKNVLVKNFVKNPKITEILSMIDNFNKRFPAKYLLSGKLSENEKYGIAATILFLEKKMLFVKSYFIPQLESSLEEVSKFEKFVADEILVEFNLYV